MSREVLLEVVEWNREDILYTTYRALEFYAKNLPFLNTDVWAWALQRIKYAADGHTFEPLDLRARGIRFEFAGPNPVSQRPLIRDGQVIWEEHDPYILVADETFMEVLPTERTRFYDVHQAIGMELAGVYQLSYNSDSQKYTFPKSYYANDISYVRALQIT